MARRNAKPPDSPPEPEAPTKRKRGRPKLGRPSKLTPEVQATILNSLRAGNYLEPSCHLANVAPQNVYLWIKRGAAEQLRIDAGKPANDDETPYREFRDAVKAAQAQSEIRDVALIAKAAEKQWQAAAWRLERKHYERWGRKQTIEVGGRDGGPIQVEQQVIRVGGKDIKF